MGGYPHIAYLASIDLDRAGQLKPGDALAFCLVTLEEARALDRTARQARAVELRRLAALVEDA
jgi:allophanate hydrolase subunit 2